LGLSIVEKKRLTGEKALLWLAVSGLGWENPGNYRIFPLNTKTDDIEAQLYPDCFLWHPIPFSYHLPYFPNNMKMTGKYGKQD
jgi:hypothetical protein